MRVVVIDPGRTSGIAIWQPDWEKPSLKEADFLTTCQLIEEMASDDVAYVLESFTITARTAQLTQAPWSLEIIGVARYIALEHGRDLVLQKPADAKRFATNPRLKALGWWHKGGGGHANDAARHLLLYVAQKRLIDMKGLVEV